MTTPTSNTVGTQSLPGQFRREEVSSGTSDTLIVWSSIVIGAVFIMIWMIKRGSGRKPRSSFFNVFKLAQGPRSIKICAHVQLTAQNSLHVVHWHGEEILLGCTSKEITVLGRQEVPVDGCGIDDCRATPSGDKETNA